MISPTVFGPLVPGVYVHGVWMPSHAAWLVAWPPAKWSPSSTVITNSVLLLSMPSSARRAKNAWNAWSWSCSCWT